MNLIFCLFQTGFLQAKQAVKIKFRNQLFRDFKNQVQIKGLKGLLSVHFLTFKDSKTVMAMCINKLSSK